MIPIVPISKIGTAFQSPSWRYQAVHSPEKFGLGKFLSNSAKNPTAKHLSRMIPNGVKPVGVYFQPPYLKQLKDKLPPELGVTLERVWNKYYFKTHTGKLTFNNDDPKNAGFISWNMTEVEKINDDFLKKLIKHCYNYEADPYITEALRMYKDATNDINRKWLNYSFYGGKTDKELAIQWHIPIKLIQTIRLMFYDYSAWPKDKLVQYSLIRQMVSNGEIDNADYHLFRRIFDLGDLGLRSVLGHVAFNEGELQTIKEYLAGAGVDVLMDQRFTINSTKDITNYSRAVADYANISLKRLEIEQKAALMRLSYTRMEKEMGIESATDMFVEDTELINYISSMTRKNNKTVFPTFVDIKSEPVKLVVEKAN